MEETSRRIMGGLFGLESPSQSELPAAELAPPFLASPRIDLANGRGAFPLLCEFLKPETVWLPSYLCSVVVDALSTSPVELRFYPVDERLRLSDDRWLRDVTAGDIVIFIDYFGFDQWSSVGAEAHRRGAWIVEDACQALLNDTFSEHADYVIFSPRKFIGVPDGGIVTSYSGATLPQATLPQAPLRWWLKSLEASCLRASFDECGGSRIWFERFREAEATAPTATAQMSELTTRLLQMRIDYTNRALRRRENYHILSEALADLALLPSPGPSTVPLGFPIILSDRRRVLEALYAEQIYPAVHWAIDGCVPTEFDASHQLSRTIATLPCDHRYGEAEMQRMALLVRRHIRA